MNDSNLDQLLKDELLKQSQTGAPDTSANLLAGIPATSPLSINDMASNLEPSDAILPQVSLQGNSPRAMPNFANAQDDSVSFMNNLFKDTPAFDPRVQPMASDKFNMDDMLIEGEPPKVQQLRQTLKKYQDLKKPKTEASQPVSDRKPQSEQEKPDDLYLQQGVSKMIQGLSRMGGGQIDDNADFYNQFRKFQLDKPQQELETKVKQRNFERMTKMDDPNSTESKNFRKALESMKYGQELKNMYGADWDKLSANDKDTIFDIIRTKENLASKELQAELLRSQKEDSREERRLRDQEKMDQKRGEILNKDIQKFQDKTQDTRNILNSINDFESVLGKNLNNLDTKGSDVKEGSKALDLPGVSVPGMGRVSFYSGDARKLRDAASNIFNVELKNRSGAAVTDNELKRLRDEFSAGKFNTESELMDAIKRYKNRTQLVLKQQESGYSPEAIKAYKERSDINSLMTEPEAKIPLDNSKKDPKIEAYASQHNLDYNKAEQILRARGYK